MQYVINEFDDIFKIIQYCEQSKLLSFEYMDRNISVRFNKMASKDTSGRNFIVNEDSNYNIYNNEVSITSILEPERTTNEENEVNEDDYVTITSPFIGTIEFSKHIKQNSNEIKVKEGDVICSVEAMKIYNDIKSTVNGTIVQILAEDGGLVEFGQPIVRIRVDKDE